MRNKILFAIFAISMIAVLLMPTTVFAWSYGRPGAASTTTYEKFGPRADKLLISLYADETSEWLTGLEAGKLDVTDWPLDDAHYNAYMTLPWNNTISVLGYGPEFGLYLFDLNNNNNQYLGNPEDPAYPNPVYPNPMSTVAMRMAVAYLTNRAAYIAFMGATTSIAMYSPVGPSSGKYADTDISPTGSRADLCYLYNPTAANATLDAGGFPVGPDGWRTWTGHGAFSIKIVSRSDSPPRAYAGADIYTSLLAAGVPCTITSVPSAVARAQVMSNKNFHIYTGGWSLSVDPDFLILWNWDYYWHPGNPYNYAGCNDAAFNTASNGVQYANDQAEAVTNSWAAQIAFATNVLSVPLWISTGFKAVSRAYTGNTAAEVAAGYTGQYWDGFVNVPGYGVDSGYSFLNMHPEGNETGNGLVTDTANGYNGNMTVRYAFKQNDIKLWNPIYAEWLWDNTVIDLIGYDSLVGRNPYNLGQFESLVASQYSVGIYNHPIYGQCTKVVFTLRPGMQWSDGTPVTIADIYFTFVEVAQILASRHLAPPWWLSNVVDILSFSILDAYNFEVLLDVKSVFALGWIGGNRILPKHIWKPICLTGDPTVSIPDPNMINSGSWRLKEFQTLNYILLVANTPKTTITSPLGGSHAVTSDMGSYRFSPVIGYVNVTMGLTNKNLNGTDFNYNVTLHNYMATSITVTYATTIIKPDGTIIVKAPGSTVILPDGTIIIDDTIPGPNVGFWKVTVNVTYDSPRPFTEYFEEGFWYSIKEDIAGKTFYDNMGYAAYIYKSELPTPDIKVDIQDVARASGAFGGLPGQMKWNAVVDQNGDYKIDIQDLARISAKFGWHA